MNRILKAISITLAISILSITLIGIIMGIVILLENISIAVTFTILGVSLIIFVFISVYTDLKN